MLINLPKTPGKHITARPAFKVLLFAVPIVLSAILFWNCMPSPLFSVTYSTVILDRNGELLGASIAGDQQWRFPSSTRVPDKFVKAIVGFEDRRFFKHPGVDPLAATRALWQNIHAGHIVSGASTITMQVIRLSRPGRPRSIAEKLIEMIMALRLEISATKNEVLALYATHAPFGGNVVGLEAAAWRYFGREPDKLSWAETAMLAVLPNKPALIHPGRNRAHLMKRRNFLLDRLQREGVIDSLTCRLAKSEPLPPEPVPIPRLAPHLLTRLQLKNMLSRENNIAGRNLVQALFRNRTTLIKDLQVRAAEIIRRHHTNLAGNGIHNAAALIVEVDSGSVLAYIGNVHQFSKDEHGNHVDVVTAPRSTGSILKPLLYAAMLESGDVLPSQLVPDIPTHLGGFAPQNYSRTYQGAVPASMALARSLNVPAVRMLQSYGVDRFYALLKNLGLTTLYRPASDYGLSLILGGAEATLWDITGIYAGLARRANDAYKRNPNISKIFSAPHYLSNFSADADHSDHDFNIGRQSHPDETLGPAASWLTLEAMLEVVRPGQEAAWRNFASSHKIAWKTGTSYGHRDGWAVGVTPRYALGVWVGNADGEGRPGLTGISTAAPILFELLGLLDHRDWFERPDDGLVEIEVCAKSGYRAGPYCAETRKVMVTKAGLNAFPCPYCRIVHYDKSLRWRVHGDCERVTEIQKVKQFVLPPVMAWYYKNTHADYRLLPTYRGDCSEAAQPSGTRSISLIYPGKKGALYVPIELDGRLGRTVFEAAHRDPATRIFWHLDDRYMGATRDIHQMALTPDPGDHIITLVDENGEHLQRYFTVLAKE
jgi:penicillin-binding protein 1C